MSDTPLVSCVVPVHNGERFLAEALQSIRNQTHGALEIIVVDDGSTDGTPGVAASFGNDVRTITQQNAGPSVARNRGIEAARGDYVAFLDADDRWHPCKLELQLARLRERPDLAWCVSLVENFWEDEVAEERDRIAGSRRSRPIPGYVTGTLLVHRRWLTRVGGFDPSLEHGDSADWFERAEASGATGELVDEVLLYRRLHRENRSRTMAEGSRQEFLHLLKARLDRRRGGHAEPLPPTPDPGQAPPIEFRHPPTPGFVTCVVPVFNGELYVADTIESILAQTYPSIEVIVVDDGSTDGTPEILRGFGDRIRVLRQDNAGPSVARNLGMSEARGEFIAFLDADDLWIPEKVEVQLERFRQSPGLDLCSGHIKSFWIPELAHEAEELSAHPYHAERPMLSPCTVLFRRDLAERVGGFDPGLRNGEDTDWFIRMMKTGAVHETLPRLLVHRRQHTSNLTRKVQPSQDRMLELIKRSLDRERAK